jgi:cytoskeletal protein RodZ
MSGERPRSTTVAVGRQTFLGSQRSGSNIVTTTPTTSNTSPLSTSPTSSPSSSSTSPTTTNDQTSTSSRSSTSFPSASASSASASASTSTPAPISSTVYSPPRAFVNGLVNIQSTPALPTTTRITSTTSFSPAAQPSGDRQPQVRGSGIERGVTQEDSSK